LSYPYSLARGKNGIIFAATGINSDNLSTTLAYNWSKDGSFSLFTDGTYGKSNINDIGKYTYTPHSMVIQNDNLAWIANPANNNLISVDLHMGNQNSYSNSSQSKGLGLFNPYVLNIDSKNRLWVLNNGTSLTSSLSVLDTSGKVPLLVKTISLSTSLNKGQTSIDFHRSSMISYGNYIWISDTANNCMYQVNINTYSVKAFGNGSGNYAFNGNTEMAVDAKGNLFVSNTDSNTITELNANTGALVQVLN
jgi:streptogramin lyase